jgi:general secretion pathway protein J
MTRAAKRWRGFTLIEVLVALLLVAITAALAWRGTAALVDGEVRLSAEAQRWRTLDLAFARLEADLRQAQPRTIRVGTTSEPAWLAAPEPNGSSAIVFSRAGPEFAPEAGMAGQRVGYRVRSGSLEVVYWPGLDREPAVAPSSWPLVDEVAQFRVDHLTGEGGWLAHWPRFGEAPLPRAVRITLTLASGETIERWFALRG